MTIKLPPLPPETGLVIILFHTIIIFLLGYLTAMSIYQ